MRLQLLILYLIICVISLELCRYIVFARKIIEKLKYKLSIYSIMNNTSNTYTCPKCGHNLPNENKLLHDVQCKGSVSSNSQVNIQNQKESSNSKTKSQPTDTIQDGSKGQQKYIPEQMPKTSTSVGKNQIPEDINRIPARDDDLYYCQSCDNYMPLNEKQDHLLGHQVEHEEVQQAGEEEEPQPRTHVRERNTTEDIRGNHRARTDSESKRILC